MVRAFGLYWGGISFECLSTHHCRSLSKSFIPSFVHLAEKSRNKKSSQVDKNGEQSGRLRKAELLIRRPPRGNGEINFSSLSWFRVCCQCFCLVAVSSNSQGSGPFASSSHSSRQSARRATWQLNNTNNTLTLCSRTTS